jgi:hypothetical protein
MNKNNVLSVLLSLALGVNLFSCLGEHDRMNQGMNKYSHPSADRAFVGEAQQKQEKYYPRWATTERDKVEYDQVRNNWDSGLKRDTGFSTRDEFEKWREKLNYRP